MNDEKHIQRCIDLAWEAHKEDKNPFASIIVDDKGEVISEQKNGDKNHITKHAEILVLEETAKKLKTQDLSNCTLYSNCEPCPMCSFMIREYKIKRVVFSVFSPIMGGYSRWPILQDKEISKLQPPFSEAPEIKGGILQEKAKKVFLEEGWTMI